MKYFKTGISLIVILLVGHYLHAQWTAPYANSWIDDDQPYVKIGILKKGLHRVPFSALPKGFPVSSPDKFQLWRRGKEVSIISTANQEIVFYAGPNDGASDSLLYRPMSARMNPYYSFYSDEGAYFLTVGNRPGNRAKAAPAPADGSIPVVTHHNEHITKVFQQDYSFGTNYPINPGFWNSYYELGASRTSLVYKDKSEAVIDFKLDDFVSNAGTPKIKLMLHGRSKNSRKLELYIGKNKNALRLVKALDNTGFAAVEYAFEIKPEDLDAEQKSVLVIRSPSSDPYERFSIAYYSIEYPGKLKMGTRQEYLLPAVSHQWSSIPVKEVPLASRMIDITDADNPVLLNRAGDNLPLPRQPGKSVILLSTSETIDVAPAKIREMHFQNYDPKAADYIIITTEALRSGAKSYADYRSSSAGGGFKPAIFAIEDIYDHFNYGEPSPVAIKKFMAYMLSGGVQDKYLFLIGKSVTQNERMVREIPGEVPTIGYPGSDALLVEGIAGGAVNAPVIPVGRLSAVTNQNITDYLQKVKAYEAIEPEEAGWRKKVLHLSGGKTTGEIVQLRDHLRALEPAVQKGIFGGTVKSYVKQQPTEEVENVDIAADLNEGVGMITFFGHGGTLITDPSIGHVRDANRGYHNLNKYPVMYFNGCGVGNVFCNRFNPTPPNPKAADRITLSLDWLVAPDRGAIAVIASSFESFVSPGITYLSSLYHHMFENTETVGLPIGKIQLAVANDVLSKHKDQYNIAYVHQSLLQGDPALRLLTVAGPDYAVQAGEGITLYSDSVNKTIGESDSLRVSVALTNLGRFVAGQVVPVEVIYTGEKAPVFRKVNIKFLASKQVFQISFPNGKDVKSIKVHIDAAQTLKELSRNNNVSELVIDWNLVKDMQVFSDKTLKDNIPPILNVSTGGRFLKQEESLPPNPVFNISLTDDRALPADTTLVDIFIRPCRNDECNFERMPYASNHLQVRASGSNALEVEYPAALAPGKYEMMVNARDASGNEVTQPYRMYFKIVKPEDMQHSLVVSPNPTTSYLRFELKRAMAQPLKSVRYLIYDQRGNQLYDEDLLVPDKKPVMEWYWQPKSNVMPGLYSYTVLLIGALGETLDVRKGKVVIQ
ncbi:Peptidase family C25 [Dyadobacter sp. SG02]|uniref:putative type IX secretion system sortase PorU2 n=1 Tax=Dyadobacter sp. SG02 TaxID=1855291 RepID=UPI0008C7744C|nr:C25 family cysteine peptidase [Dyadobacter sp. SG02]SEJ44596.1 Peptidase family C25 [Dyadobacter sp. SG02]